MIRPVLGKGCEQSVSRCRWGEGGRRFSLVNKGSGEVTMPASQHEPCVVHLSLNRQPIQMNGG
ncbi:MAG: hypothetical protein HQL80_13245, partial [Magnetococcales bacterium]|nr:hypothetical protein [Magnetococcales bacterium]